MCNDFYGERGQAIGEVARAYEEIMGRTLSRFVIDDIGYYIDRGVEPELIIKAIDITAGKGADWRYTKAILQRCVDEGIYTVYTYDWRLRYKKGLAELKRQHGELDEGIICLYLAVTVFREDIENTASDLRRYLLAVESGDISEWDERWKRAGCTFPSVNSERGRKSENK